MPLSRRGFTLVEIIIAMVMAGLVGAAIYQAILGTQRVTRAQFQRMDVQQTTRAAAFYLSNALRELDAPDGDLKVIDPTLMQYRAMRWSGVLCSPVVSVASDVVTVLRNAMMFGARGPDAVRDSLLLFRDNDPTIRTDDAWLIGDVRGVAAGGVCTDGSAGTTLTFRISPGEGGNAAALAGAVTVGSPVRGYQLEEVQLFTDAAGVNWLGQRSMDRGGSWTPWQALVGPLTATGLAFTYLNAAGAVTTVPTEVAAVGLAIRGRSAELARVGAGTIDFMRDSLFTSVALRNNARF